jgi:hypothetical protein
MNLKSLRVYRFNLLVKESEWGGRWTVLASVLGWWAGVDLWGCVWSVVPLVVVVFLCGNFIEFFATRKTPMVVFLKKEYTLCN